MALTRETRLCTDSHSRKDESNASLPAAAGTTELLVPKLFRGTELTCKDSRLPRDLELLHENRVDCKVPEFHIADEEKLVLEVGTSDEEERHVAAAARC